jgi:hypothetical protein
MEMNTTWVYVQSEPGLLTVGFYDPNGKWHSDSDHDSRESAAARVQTLNGGGQSLFVKRIQDALGTGEEGDALVEVALNAHLAEMELAARKRADEEAEDIYETLRGAQRKLKA